MITLSLQSYFAQSVFIIESNAFHLNNRYNGLVDYRLPKQYIFLGGNTMKQWDGFKQGKWTETVNVRDFIVENYDEY